MTAETGGGGGGGKLPTLVRIHLGDEKTAQREGGGAGLMWGKKVGEKRGKKGFLRIVQVRRIF